MDDIQVLHTDDQLVIVNKPAGLRSIPDGYDPKLPHLASLLQAEFGRLWTVHRLDKETSGIIIFTRSPAAHRHLSMQFEQRQVRKEYRAIVVGQPDWEQVEVTLPLRVNGDRRHRTVIDLSSGQPAATGLRLLDRFLAAPPAAGQSEPVAFSLIAAFPHSGYTHQIRAHLAALRLPLYADPLYKSMHPDNRALESLFLPIQRTALHALRVSFTHPLSEQPLTFEAAYPPDFQETLAWLTKQPGH